MSARAIKVALAFVEAINAGSAARLGELMTEDHAFIDSDGAEYRGKSTMVPGWNDYFAMVSDYRIAVGETFASGRTVMMAGEAEGTFAQDGVLKPENRWKVQAAWRAVVAGEKIAVWQLYVNPEPMVNIFNRIKGAA